MEIIQADFNLNDKVLDQIATLITLNDLSEVLLHNFLNTKTLYALVYKNISKAQLKKLFHKTNISDTSLFHHVNNVFYQTIMNELKTKNQTFNLDIHYDKVIQAINLITTKSLKNQVINETLKQLFFNLKPNENVANLQELIKLTANVMLNKLNALDLNNLIKSLNSKTIKNVYDLATHLIYSKLYAKLKDNAINIDIANWKNVYMKYTLNYETNNFEHILQLDFFVLSDFLVLIKYQNFYLKLIHSRNNEQSKITPTNQKILK